MSTVHRLTAQEAWMLVEPRIAAGHQLGMFWARDWSDRFRRDPAFRQAELVRLRDRFMRGYEEHGGELWQMPLRASAFASEHREEADDQRIYLAGQLAAVDVRDMGYLAAVSEARSGR
jgi:hypothetical protein